MISILLRVLRKLSTEKLQILLQDLGTFLDKLPTHVDQTREVRQRLAATAELLEGGEGAIYAGVANEFGDWLAGYFQLVSLSPLFQQKVMR